MKLVLKDVFESNRWINGVDLLVQGFFVFLTLFLLLFSTCLFRVSQLAAGKTQSLRRGERGSRDGEVSEQTTLALLHIYPQPSR